VHDISEEDIKIFHYESNILSRTRSSSTLLSSSVSSSNLHSFSPEISSRSSNESVKESMESKEFDKSEGPEFLSGRAVCSIMHPLNSFTSSSLTSLSESPLPQPPPLSLSSMFGSDETRSTERNNACSNVISVLPSFYSSLLFSFEKITFDVLKKVSSGGFFNDFFE
jgi:hypothetical protein